MATNGRERHISLSPFQACGEMLGVDAAEPKLLTGNKEVDLLEHNCDDYPRDSLDSMCSNSLPQAYRGRVDDNNHHISGNSVVAVLAINLANERRSVGGSLDNCKFSIDAGDFHSSAHVCVASDERTCGCLNCCPDDLQLFGHHGQGISENTCRSRRKPQEPRESEPLISDWKITILVPSHPQSPSFSTVSTARRWRVSAGPSVEDLVKSIRSGGYHVEYNRMLNQKFDTRDKAMIFLQSIMCNGAEEFCATLSKSVTWMRIASSKTYSLFEAKVKLIFLWELIPLGFFTSTCELKCTAMLVF